MWTLKSLHQSFKLLHFMSHFPYDSFCKYLKCIISWTLKSFLFNNHSSCLISFRSVFKIVSLFHITHCEINISLLFWCACIEDAHHHHKSQYIRLFSMFKYKQIFPVSTDSYCLCISCQVYCDRNDDCTDDTTNSWKCRVAFTEIHV